MEESAEFIQSVGRVNPLLDNLLLRGQECASKLSFDLCEKQQLACVCQFCRIVEITHSIRCLLKDKFTPVRISVPILLRSIFECYVDLKCSISDEGYIHCLNLDFLKQKKKITEQGIDGNRYVSDLDAYIDLESEINEINSQIPDGKDRDVRALSIFDKFDKADLDQEYRAIYSHLCCSAHNGFGALGHRHLNQTHEKVELVLFGNISTQDQIPYLVTVCGLLLGAIDLINEFLDVGISLDGDREEFMSLKEYFEAMGEKGNADG